MFRKKFISKYLNKQIFYKAAFVVILLKYLFYKNPTNEATL